MPSVVEGVIVLSSQKTDGAGQLTMRILERNDTTNVTYGPIRVTSDEMRKCVRNSIGASMQVTTRTTENDIHEAVLLVEHAAP
jgi:hypothetical protein